MKRALGSLADRGCWISHDRVYAFVSADHGLTEVGYHGLQPVSRNSRILVDNAGVLTFSAHIGEREISIRTDDVEWSPTATEATTVLPEGIFSLTIAASGRSLVARCSFTGSIQCAFQVRLSKTSFFDEVHGEREWFQPRTEGQSLVTGFRDMIMLQKWLNRTGPYAGDFLIPETIREKIFGIPKRSGLATRDDLRPEFQNTDLALYDAEVFLRLGGEGFVLHETLDAWAFKKNLSRERPGEFIIQCSDQAGEVTATGELQTERPERPKLTLTGFPQLEEFASTVPGLVNSAIVRDYGIPRACPGRYYWIWAWDSLVTMIEALRWGDGSCASSTVRFVEDHRDNHGVIPARWTRSLLPLDTPSPGGIEFLHAALTYEVFLETRDHDLLRRALPSFVTRFEAVEASVVNEGMIRGEGFYPDLLSEFGRKHKSAVCMETGSWYTFCRIIENIARVMAEPDLEGRARKAAESIAAAFDSNFWDNICGFFVDSIDPEIGSRSRFHPLFALLFLQSPLGLPLIRSRLRESAQFIARELVTASGVRTIAREETGSSREDVLDSWYPHWDYYALKVLRRAGDAESIMRWLHYAEGALSKLGYCPEFLALKGFRENDPRRWDHHGSASNLNCVTSWHRGIRESLLGFEFDPGGITHIPLCLPIQSTLMKGISWRSGLWTFQAEYDGPHFDKLIVDGETITGCLKVPSTASTPGTHTVTALYGSSPMPVCFLEITNANVLSSVGVSGSAEVAVEPLGFVEALFYSPHTPRVLINGRQTPVQWNRESGRGSFTLADRAACTLRIEKA